MWKFKLQYVIWAEVIRLVFGNLMVWKYHKYHMLQDEYQELMNDAIGCYCMGGEL